MGVVVLQPYPVPAEKTPAQLIDFIQKRILNLGAVQTGQFLVDCETYYSQPGISNAPKTLHVLHNSEQPATVFSVLESNNKSICFTSDTLFDLLLLKLTPFYSKKLKTESKGTRYELGDFIIKLGLVSANNTFKGILVEVEYLPCVIISSCWGLIHEFMQGFLGSLITNQMPAYLEQRSNEIFTPVDTVNQYLENFAQFRKMNA